MRSWRRCFSRICRRSISFGPSPPAFLSISARMQTVRRKRCTDQELDLWELGTDLRRSRHEQIDALPIRQAGNDDNHDCEAVSQEAQEAEAGGTGV
jgi:hypothetical protein